jgi:hypothetical protein
MAARPSRAERLARQAAPPPPPPPPPPQQQQQQPQPPLPPGRKPCRFFRRTVPGRCVRPPLSLAADRPVIHPPRACSCPRAAACPFMHACLSFQSSPTLCQMGGNCRFLHERTSAGPGAAAAAAAAAAPPASAPAAKPPVKVSPVDAPQLEALTDDGAVAGGMPDPEFTQILTKLRASTYKFDFFDEYNKAVPKVLAGHFSLPQLAKLRQLLLKFIAESDGDLREVLVGRRRLLDKEEARLEIEAAIHRAARHELARKKQPAVAKNIFELLNSSTSATGDDEAEEAGCDPDVDDVPPKNDPIFTPGVLDVATMFVPRRSKKDIFDPDSKDWIKMKESGKPKVDSTRDSSLRATKPIVTPVESADSLDTWQSIAFLPKEPIMSASDKEALVRSMTLDTELPLSDSEIAELWAAVDKPTARMVYASVGVFVETLTCVFICIYLVGNH